MGGKLGNILFWPIKNPFENKKEKVEPIPTPAPPPDEETVKEEEKKKVAKSAQQTQTIFTSPLGDTSIAPVTKKKLLGE